MNISDIITDDYVTLNPDTRVSKLVGILDDPSVRGVVVHGDEYEGVVTRRQLATSHRQPDEKIGSLVWNVPKLTHEDDVRTVAQLMIDSDSRILPVFEADRLIGVVTADGILEAVHEHLDAATVEQAYSADLVTVTPGTNLGRALNVFRENRITHLPVVENETAVGILSLYDITGMTIRSMEQSQGGEPAGADSHGGSLDPSSGRARRGGFGAREGEMDRILDLPVRDAMVTPVRTIEPSATLDAALDVMFDIDGSSLVVEKSGRPDGIITKTDILDALTWEAGGTRAVQLYGADLIDDIQYDDVVNMIDKFDDRDHGMNVLDAKVHLHEHDESLRGSPLLLARIRLYTDRGLFVASGEGYGARHALNEARDVLERQIRDRKTYGKSKKPRDETYWKKRFGWLLEGED